MTLTFQTLYSTRFSLARKLIFMVTASGCYLSTCLLAKIILHEVDAYECSLISPYLAFFHENSLKIARPFEIHWPVTLAVRGRQSPLAFFCRKNSERARTRLTDNIDRLCPWLECPFSPMRQKELVPLETILNKLLFTFGCLVQDEAPEVKKKNNWTRPESNR